MKDWDVVEWLLFLGGALWIVYLFLQGLGVAK